MFSRKERALLAILAEGRRMGRDPRAVLAEAFPNPAYRRKLLWGIRRKANGAAEDLELYLKASRVDRRVVTPAGLPGPYPVAADPLVRLLRAVLGHEAPRATVPRRRGHRTPPRTGGRP
jgi:hypothetical protein